MMVTLSLKARMVPSVALSPSDPQGRVASLFSLFGVFDAKGGEVVLLGSILGDLHGWVHKHMILSFIWLVSQFICHLC